MPLTMWLGWFKIQSRQRGYGTMTFSIGLAVLSLWFWEPRVLIITALVILTYADGFAAVAGSLFGKRKYQVGPVVKSLEGSITFFLVALVGVAATLYIYQTGPISEILVVALLMAVMTTAIEAVCVGDLDNGIIPVFSVIMLEVLLGLETRALLVVAGGVAGSGVLVAAAYRLRWVTIQGGLVAFTILAAIYTIGGWMWLLPIAFLLVSASLVAKVTGGAFDNPFVEKKGPRDLFQIAAKGGPSLLLALAFALSGWAPLYIICLAVIATASADTWASSFGEYAQADPIRSLPLLRNVPKGLSGGVTLTGSVAALVGSALVAAFAFLCVDCVDFVDGADPWLVFGLVALSGWLGAVVDSILGTTVQAVYDCPKCSRQTEAPQHCGEATTLVKGLAKINNDVVNLLSGTVGGLIAAALVMISMTG
ncbi:MAG: DUF92 domain-containing protein, partial [Myxococcota bacterium]